MQGFFAQRVVTKTILETIVDGDMVTKIVWRLA